VLDLERLGGVEGNRGESRTCECVPTPKEKMERGKKRGGRVTKKESPLKKEQGIKTEDEALRSNGKA